MGLGKMFILVVTANAYGQLMGQLSGAYFHDYSTSTRRFAETHNAMHA